MKIQKTICISPEDLQAQAYDLFIVCSGYEKRATYLSQNFEIIADKKLCLMFDSLVNIFNRKLNDFYFENNGFEMIKSNIDSYLPLKEYLFEYISKYKKETLKIIIDYSSMSRVWYSFVLNFFDKIDIGSVRVEIIFSYSQSKYVPPPEILAYKSYISPIEGYYSILPPTKPTALILSLGYIERQAFGLAEYFEAEPFIFISKNSEDDVFYNAVLKSNKMLLSKVQDDNIFYYSMSNLTYTESMLYHLCRELSTKFRIVIAPCGPKPFTLISLITCIKLGDIDVWRISASSNNKPVDKIENGELIISKVIYSAFAGVR